MNKRVKSTAIMMAIIITLSVFTSIAAVSTVAAATATTTTITASNKYPAVGQSVTFTVTLKAGTTGLSKSVKIWHTTPDGKRYEDGTHPTVNGVYTFKQAFASKGQRMYHAEFAGDSQYSSSSGTVTVNVGMTPTTTIITASNTNPAVGSAVTLSVTVKAGTTVLTNKQVTVTHTHPGGTSPSSDGVFDTGSTGTKTFSSGTYGSAGQRVYTAVFAGDGTHAKSSGTVTVTVHAGSTPTVLRIEAQTQTPTPNHGNYMTVRLWSGTSVLGGKTVELHVTGSNTYLYSVTTYVADGAATKDVRLPAGEYWVYATFAGSANFAPCRSNLMYVKVATTVPTKKPTTLYVYTGAPHQKTTVNAPFVLNGALETGGTPSGNKRLTIIYLYKPPSGSWSAVKTLATINSGNGFYSYLWKAPAKGEYVFRVGYNGDSGYSGYYGSASNDLDVIVS